MDILINGKKIINTTDIPQEAIEKLEKTLESTGKIEVIPGEGSINVEVSATTDEADKALGVTRKIFMVISVAVSLGQTAILFSFGRAFNLINHQNAPVSIVVGFLIGYVSQKLAERSVRNFKIKGFVRPSLLFTGRLAFINDFQISLISGRNALILNLMYSMYLATLTYAG